MNKYIIWITGASGTGKTTLLNNLKSKYSDRKNLEFVKFDSIGVPSPEEMIKEFGSQSNWQKAKTEEWVKNMLAMLNEKDLIIMDGQANLDFIKDAFNSHGFKNYKIILVECAQDDMVKRLVDERQQAWLASEDMKNWLRFLHDQAVKYNEPIIDTTNLDPDQTVAKFEEILQKDRIF